MTDNDRVMPAKETCEALSEIQEHLREAIDKIGWEGQDAVLLNAVLKVSRLKQGITDPGDESRGWIVIDMQSGTFDGYYSREFAESKRDSVASEEGHYNVLLAEVRLKDFRSIKGSMPLYSTQ